MINFPGKLFGAEHTIEEIIKDEVVEIDKNFADTKNISNEIKNGTISPMERKHYEAGLLQIQTHGIKGLQISDTYGCFFVATKRQIFYFR